MIKQVFFNAVSKLNEKNYHSFISVYGVITDEEVAKAALCVTCKAWYVLSDELKQNADVIMYYQPNLRVEEQHDMPVGLLEFDTVAPYQYFGIFSVSDTGFVGRPGNKAELSLFDDDLRRICSVKGEQQPDIEYPEDFNFDLYYAIQERLRISKFYSLEEAYNNEQLYAMLPAPYQDKNGLHVGQVTVEVYNRSNLHEIVQEMTTQYTGSARQRH